MCSEEQNRKNIVSVRSIFKRGGYEFKTFGTDNFEDFRLLNQDVAVSKYVNHNGGKPKTFRECIEKYNDIIYTQRKYGYSYWAVYGEKTGEFIGQCGAMRSSWDNGNNFCYAFREEYWGRGVGTEVCRFVVEYLFDNFLDIDSIETSVIVANVASLKILRKIGFTFLHEEEEFEEKLQFFKLWRLDYENGKYANVLDN